MWQVVRGRKASLVTNSVVYSLILRWISDECCCLEIAGWVSTWKLSTVPNQAAVLWLLPLLCAFLLFLYMSILSLSLFSILPDFRLLLIQNNRWWAFNLMCCIWCFEAFLSTTYPLMLETHILSTNPYNIFGLPNK